MHLVDLDYMSSEMLVSAEAHDVDVVGPMRGLSKFESP